MTLLHLSTQNCTMSAFTLTLFIFCLMALAGEATAVQNVRVFSAERGPKLPKNGPLSNENGTVRVNLLQSLNSISSHFIGVTIDAGQILLNWSTLDFNSKKVQGMAKALSPCYFRLGGTYADTMTYDLGSSDDDADEAWLDKSDGTSKVPPFNLTAKEWNAVYDFSQRVGWEFIMDLNALKRNPDGSWDTTNARQLLKYSADRNFTIVGFELGNEYDVYKQSFNVTVSPAQLARDVASLEDLLSEFPPYSSSFIIGPETATGVDTFFAKFLADGGAKVVRAASFHQYYFAAGGSHVSDFVSINIMNQLNQRLDEVFAVTRFVDPLLPVWLSETSSAYNSGTPNVSDRFVAGFLWLDKLGVCASKGVQSVVRQAFYGGHYSLVNASLDPNPDFWLTVLYRRLVRGAVFSTTAPSDIRVYAACANPQHYKPGGVVLYMLNPNPYPVTLDLPQFSQLQLSLFSLTAGDDLGLVSRYTALNGAILKLVDDKLPEFVPELLYGSITMEAYSFMFVLVEDAKATICMERP